MRTRASEMATGDYDLMRDLINFMSGEHLVTVGIFNAMLLGTGYAVDTFDTLLLVNDHAVGTVYHDEQAAHMVNVGETSLPYAPCTPCLLIHLRSGISTCS